MEKAIFLSEFLGFVIVILPAVIFFWVFVPIFNVIKKMKGFENLLSDTEQITIADENDPAKNQIQTPKRSASRLILLLSGLTAIVLAVCISCYYFYMNIYCINCNMPLDLTDFSKILLALGIGVIPYAANRFKKST